MPSNHLILCHPLSSCLQCFPASGSFPVSWLFILGGQSIGASTSVLFNEYSGLISFRIDWLDLLAVQATLKSLLLHHSSKASILQHSAFFSIQLSHLHMTTGKTLRVLDSKGYHNKIPKQGGPNHSHLLSHSSGGWKSKFKMLAVLISLEVLLPGLQKVPFLLCLHMDFLCVCISLFMKGPSDTDAVPYLGPF